MSTIAESSNHELKASETLGAHDHAENGYQGSGGQISRFITPGGNPIDSSQPAFPIFHRKFGNPAPLGLMSFAATTLVLSLFNCQARGVTTPNVILGIAMGYGGLGQIIAGIEEWACGNTFGATAFASYGGFWLSFGTLYIPQFGVAAAYTDEKMFANAVGIYLVAWGVVTFLFFLALLRSSVSLLSVFFFLDITFWVLAGGFFTGNESAIKAGGVLGVITAVVAMYTALAGLLTDDTSYFILPTGDLSKKR